MTKTSHNSIFYVRFLTRHFQREIKKSCRAASSSAVEETLLAREHSAFAHDDGLSPGESQPARQARIMREGHIVLRLSQR